MLGGGGGTMKVPSFMCSVKLRAPPTVLLANRTTGTIRTASRRTVQIAAAHPPRPWRALCSLRRAGYEATAMIMPQAMMGTKGTSIRRHAAASKATRPTLTDTSNGPGDIGVFVADRSMVAVGVLPKCFAPTARTGRSKKRAVGNYMTFAAASCAARAKVAAWTATAIRMPVIVSPSKAIMIAITLDTLCTGLKSP
jgi:hypothetical protein